MATAIEYGLVAALVAVAGITAVDSFRPKAATPESKAEAIVRKMPVASYNMAEICDNQRIAGRITGPTNTAAVVFVVGTKCDSDSAVIKTVVNSGNDTNNVYIVAKPERTNTVSAARPPEATL